ncbi:MAG: bifunctional hydroxymethylpyrimidine kinase/phosphomethylpyrimidine kinase [Candidatus Hinthialibacter antarcticus]|nr:bifunctional hydroxymethylpyrimidine kinase/phosphomethylpyrimidine kinase [Candidatus Hinthialibacter antarcticus]
MKPVALTIAGSDPSGGAGLQADLKTFHQHGVYGMSVVTLLTVQNTQSVDAVQMLEPDFVLQQLNAVLNDIPPTAIKTGALGGAAMIEAVAQRVKSVQCPLVVDPVMISKHGHSLIEDDAVEKLVQHLIPSASLVTPNLYEASAISNIEIKNSSCLHDAAKAILDLGAKAVVIKAGANNAFGCDLLATDSGVEIFRVEWIDTPNTHGTGCVFSAAITAHLAKGSELRDAVAGARSFMDRAIRTNPNLGKGRGPVNHQAPVD